MGCVPLNRRFAVKESGHLFFFYQHYFFILYTLVVSNSKQMPKAALTTSIPDWNVLAELRWHVAYLATPNNKKKSMLMNLSHFAARMTIFWGFLEMEIAIRALYICRQYFIASNWTFILRLMPGWNVLLWLEVASQRTDLHASAIIPLNLTWSGFRHCTPHFFF